MTTTPHNNDNNNIVYSSSSDYILDGEENFSTRTTLRTNNYSPSTDFVQPSSSLRERISNVCGRIISNVGFEKTIMTMIIINSLCMGIATFDFVTNNPRVERIIEGMDMGFLVLFTMEQILVFLHRGTSMFEDWYLLFDFIIIVSSWCFATIQIIRAFRIVRVFRLVTHNRELSNLVLALFSVIPKLFAVMALLLLLFYIYGVMFTHLFKDLYKEGYTSQDYFSRLDITMFTLFQIMTLASWSEITKEVMKVYSWAWILFISFALVSSFVVINLMIAVICNAVSHVESANNLDQLIVQPTIEYIVNTKYDHMETSSKMETLEAKIDQLTSTVELLVLAQQKNNAKINQTTTKTTTTAAAIMIEKHKIKKFNTA